MSGSGIYHVMMRGVNKQRIFERDGDYKLFLNRLWGLVDPVDDNGMHVPALCHVYAYCLMPNHVHLLLRERSESVSQCVKRLSVSYAQYYNNRYERVGHLFQGRFRSEPVGDMAYFVTLLRYIHQNPVKAGICSRVEDYRWSSWSEYRISDMTVPTLTYTAVVLRQVPFAELQELVCEPVEDGVSGIEYADECRLGDDELRQYLRLHWKMNEASELRQIGKAERNEVLMDLIQFGGGLRQIARVAGIDYGVVQRLKKKIKD